VGHEYRNSHQRAVGLYHGLTFSRRALDTTTPRRPPRYTVDHFVVASVNGCGHHGRTADTA